MASKTDSFFIRATIDASGTYGETEIDLGAYVDALGKSVLKIHNVQVQMQDSTTLNRPPLYNAGSGAEVAWQLLTTSQAGIVRPSNRSVVSSGLTSFASVTGGQLSSDAPGVNVHMFTDGYLVAVEQMYLGAQQIGITNDTAVSVVLECTVQTLTQSAAMALALSQQ